MSTSSFNLPHHLYSPDLTASTSNISPPNSASLSSPPITVRILPTAHLKHLRLKLLKSLKAPRGAKAELWLKMADGKFAQLADTDEGGADEDKEVEWWLENDSDLAVYVRN